MNSISRYFALNEDCISTLGIGVFDALHTKQAEKALQYIVVCFLIIFL